MKNKIEELRIKIQESRQVTKSLEKELDNLYQEEYAKEIFALKGKCYASKTLKKDNKWTIIYKIIDVLAKMKIVKNNDTEI